MQTQLKVIVKKLNRRTSVPSSFSDKNISGTINEGALLLGEEVEVINHDIGRWYRSADGGFYWGGGLLDLGIPLGQTVKPQQLEHLPDGCRLGVDVSHHNSIPDWKAFSKSGVSFMYIKLSEGVGSPDGQAADNAQKAKAEGLKIGYYHFCRPDTRNGGSFQADAKAEADDVIDRLQRVPSYDLPVVLDLEDQSSWDSLLSKTDYEKWILGFIDHLTNSGIKEVMIYSRKEYLDRHLPEDHKLGMHKLWLSRYKQPTTLKVECPKGWADWHMWQYTETGSVGMNLKIDMNILKPGILF